MALRLLAAYKLEDRHQTKSKFSVRVEPSDLSLSYSLGSESLSNLGKGIPCDLPDFFVVNTQTTLKLVEKVLKASYRDISSSVVSPSNGEFDGEVAGRTELRFAS